MDEAMYKYAENGPFCELDSSYLLPTDGYIVEQSQNTFRFPARNSHGAV